MSETRDLNVRMQAALLEALDLCEMAAPAHTLAEIADPREGLSVTPQLAEQALLALEAIGWAEREGDPTRRPLWSITAKGRAHLIANQVQDVAAECRRGPQPEAAQPRIHATRCNHVEPKVPATALICITEDELDEWWQSLDADLKADAFAGFALRMHSGEDSHVYVEPNHSVGVPIIGTVGETPEQWAAMADRLKAVQS